MSEMITIERYEFQKLINRYCSCGGRGPDDEPCPACAIYHDLIRAAIEDGQIEATSRVKE